MADEDLKACWRDLGVGGAIVDPVKPWSIEDALTEAATRTSAELSPVFASLHNQPLTAEKLQELVVCGTQTFVKHWLGALQQQDLGGLLGFMVDGLKLPAVELSVFVRALPSSTLSTFVQSRVGSARGTHALLALEWHRRHEAGKVDYVLFEQDGVVKVRIITADGEMTFGLDEAFEG